MQKVTDLSIIIVNWNTRDMLAKRLRSVSHNVCRLRSSSVKTFVVDNSSIDDSTQMVRERFHQVHLIENPENVDFARANNQAIQLSQGRYVLLLNSDTEVYPGALDTMVQFMEGHPQVGGCEPRLLKADGSPEASYRSKLPPEGEFWRLMFFDHLWCRATYAQKR